MKKPISLFLALGLELLGSIILGLAIFYIQINWSKPLTLGILIMLLGLLSIGIIALYAGSVWNEEINVQLRKSKNEL